MKLLNENKALRRQRVLRLNILAALVVLIVSAYMVITGEYSSLQERQSADQIYNILIIGSIIYMAAVWISCVMTKPFWFPGKSSD
ncbi:MAG: hypothetical protein OQK95_12135 [Gammaproteobacteria bacterium]|nr:hypothetical protein [Gammaproteobacteria bacterium]MCW9032193.1 hypothetical protein [Gammaproteobacteria bacterium]